MKTYLLALFTMLTVNLFGQTYAVKGKVTDQYGSPLIGATVTLSEDALMTDVNGNFQFTHVGQGMAVIVVSYIGYETLLKNIDVKNDLNLDLHLSEDVAMLDNIVVSIHDKQTIKNTERISNQQLVDKFSGSFAKSLEAIPGVNAMEIGANASKPIIRGLGFNRVVVAENGAKQEGQQWGADHGLEIDSFSAEEVEVIKGVGAIEYGSDAIGGVIKINNEKVPQVHSVSGQAIIFGKTVNDSYGISAQVKAREEKFFFKLKATAQDMADYRVPTNRIYYLDTNIPIYGGRMKNTAGKNLALYGQIGYVDDGIKNVLSISNVYDKSGFFPGAHGLPNVSAVKDDGNHRDIALPNQNVNHFKVVNNTTFDLNDESKLLLQVSFQNNRRQEMSKFHSHFDGQTAPETAPNLELQFTLNTFETTLKYEHLSLNNHKTTAGIQLSYQNNTIAGYGFLLPKYNRSGVGAFITHEHYVNERFSWEAGARVDYAEIHIKEFYDEVLYDYLKQQGHSHNYATSFAKRSEKTDRDFTSFNGMIGAKYNVNSLFNIAATVGTNFRFPTAIELASNGVHHGAFRHEQGNPNLKPEQGIVGDVRLEFKKGNFNTNFSPYVYYFTNYIYLKPSGRFSVLPDSGQIYQYSQSQAFITGFEWQIQQRILERFSFDGVLEYVYNMQISNKKGGYPLPFTTPMNFYGQVKYEFSDYKFFKQPEAFLSTKWYAKQSRIAQGEEVTPSSISFGGGVSSKLKLGGIEAKASIVASNIFNKKILNHTSFYRALEIPELGRSFQLMIQVPF